MILQTNPDLLNINKTHEMRKLRLEIKLMTERFLRKKLDTASFDYEGLAAIELAKENKIDSAELEVDYHFALSTAPAEEGRLTA